MNTKNIILGYNGFGVKGFARSVLLSQLAFAIQRALARKEREDAKPVHDAATDAALADIFGGSPVPETPHLDIEAAIKGHAAAYILLAEAVNEVSPDTGRRPEHLNKRLLSLSDGIVANVDRLFQLNVDRARASAQACDADMTARIKVLKAEADKEAERQKATVRDEWINAVKSLKGESSETLADIATEALEEAGFQPSIELRRAADSYLAAMKRLIEKGQFAQVDMTIYAVSTKAAATNEPKGEAVPGPEDVATATN